jgi:hypothetical protein
LKGHPEERDGLFAFNNLPKLAFSKLLSKNPA